MHYKSLLLPCFLFVVLFALSGCAKESVEKENTTKKIAELSAYIDSLGTFEPREIVPLITRTVSETKGAPQQLNNNGYQGWYTPITTKSKLTGFELRINEPPTRGVSEIWPGNLVQGKYYVQGECVPIPLGGKRTPGNIRLNVVSGDTVNYFRTVDFMDGSNTVQVMNDILAPYTSGFPANISIFKSTVSSIDEMAYYMNLDPSEFNRLTEDTFKGVNWSSKTTNRVMVKLRQVYFTMAYDFPGIKEAFTSDISIDDFKAYSSEDNPPCYISSVSYGRFFILLYESGYSRELLNDTMAEIFTEDENSPKPSVKAQQMLNHSTLVYYQVGGDPDEGLKAALSGGDANAIHDFIIKGANFSKDNVGEVIDYEVNYLSNSLFVNRYKEIATTVENTSFEAEEKRNNVQIAIRRISSPAVYQFAGNGFLSTKSWFTAGDVTLQVVDKTGKVKKTAIFNPNITKIDVKNIHTERHYDFRFATGELGVNTTDRIRISQNVHYYIRRRKVGSQSRDFLFHTEYEFDTRTQRWKNIPAAGNSSYGSAATDPLHKFVIVDGVNSCMVNYTMDFTFTANRVTY